MHFQIENHVFARHVNYAFLSSSSALTTFIFLKVKLSKQILRKQKISPFNTTKLVTMTKIFVMPRPNNSLLATIL